MDPVANIASLETSSQVIGLLAGGLPPDQTCRKPSPTAWSILEVINHLADEEREDFRTHLDDLLHRPGSPWREIDPPGRAIERGNNKGQLQASLDDFLRERATSLAWLRGLQNPAWQNIYQLPWGALSAADLLTSWAAHDLLHIRQLTEIRYALLTQSSPDANPGYAGEW